MFKVYFLGIAFNLILLSVVSGAISDCLPVVDYADGVPETGAMPATDSIRSFQRGKEVYRANCLSCHQFDGGGVENMNPPLIKTKYVLGNKARFIQIILKGFDQRVDVDGELYSNNMPPLNFLTDRQIADVLTYVRNDFGNKATAVLPAEVLQVRKRLTK